MRAFDENSCNWHPVPEMLSGYLITPIARAYGMVLTILPTLIAYAWLTWRLLVTSG